MKTEPTIFTLVQHGRYFLDNVVVVGSDLLQTTSARLAMDPVHVFGDLVEIFAVLKSVRLGCEVILFNIHHKNLVNISRSVEM